MQGVPLDGIPTLGADVPILGQTVNVAKQEVERVDLVLRMVVRHLSSADQANAAALLQEPTPRPLTAEAFEAGRLVASWTDPEVREKLEAEWAEAERNDDGGTAA